MIGKIIKHINILNRRFNEKKELEKAKTIDNKTLSKVLESIIKVKFSKYNSKENNFFKECELYRNSLLTNDRMISYEVFGIDKMEMVSTICKKATSKIKFCQLLYCLIDNLNFKSVLEIGTNLGVSGTYMLKALKKQIDPKFISMEGVPGLCKISSKQFSSIIKSKKVNIIEGLYDETFPILIKQNHLFDFVFIDGNHREKSTLNYFDIIKKNSTKNSVFVFDDINWSKGMINAWNKIKNDKDVNYSIDLYQQGIVIIDKNDPDRNINFKLHLSY